MAWQYFDFGLPKDVEPDWETAEVDLLAEWIISQIPEEMLMSMQRGICNSYQQCIEACGVPIACMRAYDGENLTIECRIESIEHESGSFDKAVVTGKMHFHKENMIVQANMIQMDDIPDCVINSINEGTLLSDIIGIKTHQNREIISVKKRKMNKGIIINLKPVANKKWIKLYTDCGF